MTDFGFLNTTDDEFDRVIDVSLKGTYRLAKAFGPAPGPFETPLTKQIKSDPDWYGAYVDKTVLNAGPNRTRSSGRSCFLPDASTYVTGTLQGVDGGWTAIDGRFVPKV